jgi:hypothetical protein
MMGTMLVQRSAYVCLAPNTTVPFLLHADIVRHQFERYMLTIEIVLSGTCQFTC